MIEPDQEIKTCLVDSNIWLYAFIETQDAGKSAVAKSLIQKKDVAIAVSTQIINEVCVNLIRKARFPEEKIRDLIESFYQKYDIIGIDKTLLLKSSTLRDRHHFSFWDSVIFASALIAGVDILYSEDLQDGFFMEETIIVNPFKNKR